MTSEPLEASLDPEVKVVIDGIRRAKTPALSSCAIADARRMYAKGLRILDIAPQSGVEADDRALATGGRMIPVRVYRPEGHVAFSERVLLWFHDGGFCVGSVETADLVCRMLAFECRCTVVSVEYRLAPEHPFPAAVEDAFEAYCAVLQQLDDNAAARRAIIAGESAGATLSLVSALLARDNKLALPAALYLVYPTVLGRRETESKRRYGEGLFLTRADLDWFYAQYSDGRDLDNDFRFAPIVTPSFAGLPRTYIAAAECDPLHDDAVALAKALTAAGCRVQFEDLEGLTHGFFHMGGFVSRTRDAQRDGVAFLLDAWREAEGTPPMSASRR
jgi:acetyl esterase